jgi:hypothetical protein
MKPQYLLPIGILFLVFSYIQGEHLNSVTVTKSRDLPLVSLQRSYVDIATLGYRAAWDRIIHIWTIQQAEADPKNTSTEELHRIYLNAAKLRPKSESLFVYTCSQLGVMRKKFPLCIDILQIGVELFPNSWILYNFLGLSYFLSRDDANAFRAFEAASKIPNAPATMQGVVNKMKREGKIEFEDAVGSVDTALEDSSLERLRQRLEKEKSSHE